MGAETGISRPRPRDTEDPQKLEEARKGLPRASEGAQPSDTLTAASGLQDCERVSSCCWSIRFAALRYGSTRTPTITISHVTPKGTLLVKQGLASSSHHGGFTRLTDASLSFSNSPFNPLLSFLPLWSQGL